MESTRYEKEEGDTGISFEKGFVVWWAYSYQISSIGSGELSENETRKLYEAMKNYYEGSEE